MCVSERLLSTMAPEVKGTVKDKGNALKMSQSIRGGTSSLAQLGWEEFSMAPS